MEKKIFLSLLILYFFFLQWYGWNEESHFALVRAIVDEKRFEIDSFANQTGDRAFFKNHYYTDKDPGLAFLSSFPYSTWKLIYTFFPSEFKTKYKEKEEYVTDVLDSVKIIAYVDRGFFIFTSMIILTFLTSSLFTSLTAILIYKISRYFLNEYQSAFLAMSYGVATLAFPYALHFMSHAAAAFFSFFSFFLLFSQKIKREAKKIMFLAGIFSAFSIVIDKSLFLISLFLIFYSFIFRERRFFLLGFSLAILPLFLYNASTFKGIFEFGSAYIDREIYRSAYPQSTFSVKIIKAGLGTELESILRYFHFIPSLPNIFIVYRILFDPYRGFFFYSPIFLLSIFGLVEMFKKFKIEAILILFILISFLCIISMRKNWWGGYCFGERYLLPIVPFFTLPLIFSYKKFKKIFILLFIISAAINFLGLQPAEDWAYDWNNMEVNKEWQNKQNSFQIIRNPLLEHYLPLTLKYGPRSNIFEQLINGYISIDIRFPPLSKGIDFPYSKFHIPFLSLLIVWYIEVLIWWREIKKLIE